MTDPTPIVRTAADLARFDNQAVRLVGTYRRHAVEIKMGRPPQHMGHVVIEVEGQDIRLGADVRPEDERNAWDGKPVLVQGTLQLRPPSNQPEWVAQPDPEPTLQPTGPVKGYAE